MIDYNIYLQPSKDVQEVQYIAILCAKKNCFRIVSFAQRVATYAFDNKNNMSLLYPVIRIGVNEMR